MNSEGFLNKSLMIEVKHFQQTSNKDGKEYTNLRLTNVKPLNNIPPGSSPSLIDPGGNPSQNANNSNRNENWL